MNHLGYALSVILVSVLAGSISSCKTGGQGGAKSSTNRRALQRAVTALPDLDKGAYARVWDAADAFALKRLQVGDAPRSVHQRLGQVHDGSRVQFRLVTLSSAELLLLSFRRLPSSGASFSGGRASVFSRRSERWAKLGSIESRASVEFSLVWRAGHDFVMRENRAGAQRDETSLILVSTRPNGLTVRRWDGLINPQFTLSPRSLSATYSREFETLASSVAGPFRQFTAKIRATKQVLRLEEASSTPWLEALEARCREAPPDRIAKVVCPSAEVISIHHDRGATVAQVRLTVAKGVSCDAAGTWWSAKLVVSVRRRPTGEWLIHSVRSSDPKCNAPGATRAR